MTWGWVLVGVAVWLVLVGLAWAFIHGATRTPTPKADR